MRTFWIGLCVGWMGVAALVVASSASAEDDAAQEQAALRLEENWASVQSAQARLVALEAAYSRGMTSRDLVGEPREKVVQGIAAAKREIAAARAAHGELFEAARRSGVPWSVLDRYEALPAPPAAPRPTLEDSPDDVTLDSENLDALGDAASEDSDDLEGQAEDVDDAPDSDGENVDAVDGAESEDSDDLRATSRDPD
jgi:hypothetical protein